MIYICLLYSRIPKSKEMGDYERKLNNHSEESLISLDNFLNVFCVS